MNQLFNNLKYLNQIRPTTDQELVDYTGAKQSTINRIRNGRTQKPNIQIVEKIAEFYGVDPSDLKNSDLMKNNELKDPRLNIPRKSDGLIQSKKERATILPILDIDQAIDYAINPKSVEIGNCEEAATKMPHSSRAFAVRMFDNSMRSESALEESFNKGDILIAEPQIEPRHEDIVVVNLNPELKIGMVAKLEIDPFGKRRLRRTGQNIAGENPMNLPQTSYICGVVIEVKRRTISPDEAARRLNPEYCPRNSITE